MEAMIALVIVGIVVLLFFDAVSGRKSKGFHLSGGSMEQEAEDRELARRVLTANQSQATADGPGKFRVDGVDRASGMDTTCYVRADSAANAKAKGELQGVVVTLVTRQA